MYDGFRNRYSFEKDGKIIKLHPLTPKQVYEDQLILKSKVEQIEKVRLKYKKEK